MAKIDLNGPTANRVKVRKQEGAELCQAQSAKHKLFGSNGAFFWFKSLKVELLNC